MLESIRSIPGPVFLVLYGCVAAICIFAARMIAASDNSRDSRMPEAGRFGPYAVACLRGGIPAVIQAALFALHHYGYIVVTEEKKFLGTGVSLAVNMRASGDLNEIEKAVLDRVTYSEGGADLTNDKSLRAHIQSLMAGVLAQMQEARLVRSPGERSRAKLISMLFLMIMVGIGASKLALGVYYGKPVVFLVALLIASIVAFIFLVQPGRLQTQLGADYLKSLAERFAWMQKTGKDASFHPAFGVAVFGASMLSGTAFAQYLNSRNFSNSSGCSGGCGGGGGGGGGCGGCGGCGGD